MFGLGSTQMGIGIAVSLQDRFSPQARAVSDAMSRMQRAQSSLVNQATNDYQRMATNIATAGAGISYGLLEAMRVGAKFEKQIQKISIVSEGAMGKQKIGGLARKLSEEFRMSPIEVSHAIFENVKAGVTDNIDLITKYQIAVATATEEMLEGQDGVAKGLLNITNSMQINYSNFAQVANAVTVAANRTMASVNSLTEGMAYSANDFFQLYGGKSQESRIDAMSKNLAALGMLSQMGIEGSSAGVAIANLLRYATTGSGAFASKRQQASLGMLGLKPSDLRDSNGNVMDMLQMLDLFAERASKLGSGEQLDAMFGLLGVRGKKGGINLMGQDGRGVTTRSLYEEIKRGIQKDIAISQAKQMMDNLEGDFMLVKAKWIGFLIDFTKAVEPFMRKLVPLISKGLGMMSSFVNTGVGGLIAKVVVVVTPIITVMFAFRAALLAATIALGRMSTVTNFRNVLAGATSNMALAGLAGAGIVQNAAGRYVVARGAAIPFGGRTYTGGMFLPRAALGMGAATGLAGAAAASGRLVATGVGRMVGFLAGPWGMGISLALAFLPEIYNLLSDEKKAEDPTLKGYLPNGFNGYLPGYDKDRADALNRLGFSDIASQELKQKIEIHVNGELQQTLDNSFNTQQLADTLNQVSIDF